MHVSIVMKAGFGKCPAQFVHRGNWDHDVGLGTGEGAIMSVGLGVTVGETGVGVGTGDVSVGTVGSGVGVPRRGSGKKTSAVPQIILSATRALMTRNILLARCALDIRLTHYLP
jgi:hypothetical protein